MRTLWLWLTSSLRRKLSFIMLISTLVPLLSFAVFTYMISSDITEEKTKQAGIDTLKQMEANLRFVVSDLENMSISLIGQSDIQEYLNHEDDNEIIRSRILAFMTNLASAKTYISNITIYPYSPFAYLSTATIYENGLHEQLDIRQVHRKMWSSTYTLIDYAGNHQVFTYIRPIRSIYAYQEIIGWLSISLDEEVLSKYWSEPNLGDGLGQVALLNEQGLVLSSTERGWMNQSFDIICPDAVTIINRGGQGEIVMDSDGVKRMLLHVTQPDTGWTLVGTIPYDFYRSQNEYILQLTAGAVIVTIFINAMLVIFVIQRVTNPLRILSRLLTKVNPDGPMPYYQATSRDEIGKLGESYNLLGSHIRQLKEQLIRDETRKKEAEMRALQAQINPHFLYNTLSSVHWMALMRDEKQIADMVGALSDFLQFSLNKGNDYCPVHQEISHIRNYTQIQQMRYPDQFELDLAVDPSLMNSWMLKLLLQPLIENAMIHGILRKGTKGMIGVYLERKGDMMHVLVMDDGCGMKEEDLNKLKESLIPPADQSEGFSQTGGGYGLRNVNERLRLHYGPESCLQIESRPMAGTRISFTIPLMEGKSRENHDRG